MCVIPLTHVSGMIHVSAATRSDFGLVGNVHMYSCRGGIDFSVPGSSRANRACSWAMSAWGDLWTFCVYKDKKTKRHCIEGPGPRL